MPEPGGAGALEQRALRLEADRADVDQTGRPVLAAVGADVLVALAANEPLARGERGESEGRIGHELRGAELMTELGHLLLELTVALRVLEQAATRSRSSAVRSRPASSAVSKMLLASNA